MDLDKSTRVGIALFFILFFAVAGVMTIVYMDLVWSSFILPRPVRTLLPAPFRPGFTQGAAPFTSEKEFTDYVEASDLGYVGYAPIGAGFGIRQNVMLEERTDSMKAMEAPQAFGIGGGAEPERVSGTNVQVLGIDEPDIVKTDGKEIYFSKERNYYWSEPVRFESEMIMPPQSLGGVKIIKAFPPGELKALASIDKTGDLLLYKDKVVIFSQGIIYGYDILDPSASQKKWEVKLAEDNYLVSARSFNDKIYVVTKTMINRYHPCPLKPISIGGAPLTIACTDIYHPITNIPVDVTFTAFVLNPETGQSEKTISFVGSSDSSIVYMSLNNIYVTYVYYSDMVEFYYNFLDEKCRDLIPAQIISRIGELIKYDISQQSKMNEFAMIFEEYLSSLNNDEELRLENELINRTKDYYGLHLRELERTGIAKISLDKFKVETTGDVPGQPLNQFSLDEYQGYLRIATTIGSRSSMFGGTGESISDVYVLNKNLGIIGSARDMGKGERIYSVRFLEDRGYIVTFRETDPFYVLDLSNQANPTIKGELKIPGYSSYLHPIASNRILGIGKESSQVKISLFDVANPSAPTEVAKYTLDEYWSDILNTHHAFLLDTKHQIFFLPGSKGGYVFAYVGDALSLKRAVSDIIARRALYINDYLYIVGDDKLSVLNEIDWEKVNELTFE